MKFNIKAFLLAGMVALSGLSFLGTRVYAEGEPEVTNNENYTTSISLKPVSKIIQLASKSEYEDTFTVNNDGDADIRVEVYAAPYSYVYSSEEDAYKLGFSNENNFTQISRWITFDDGTGNYAKKPIFTVKAKESLEIKYKISTPDSIPAGGQYAVIFAHTLTSVVSASGIKTEASPGLVIYGRSTEGETIVSAEISNMNIEQSVKEGDTVKNKFHASAKVKNNGNIDFNAKGTLKVDSVFGGGNYETPSNGGIVSVIPETELLVADEWKDSPDFGLYKVTWTVTAGDKTETIEKMIFLISPLAIIITIILLTIIIVWIIILVRKRKERRSRLAI